jgi:eukaryotic-like serine/threonine-protein kinase
MSHDSEAFLEKALSAAFSPDGPEETVSPRAAPPETKRRAVDDRVPEFVGRFKVVDVVGRGGAGVVYRAKDDVLNREVAVKVLRAEHKDDPEMARRFVGEGRAGGALQHPGTIPIHEAGATSDGRPYLVMRLVEGETLADRLRSRATPDADRGAFVSIFERACQIVAYAHARGDVHLDLKPANILLGAFGEVVVTDWGFGRDLEDRPGGGRRARVVGTPSYMAPEQARGDVARFGPKVDVFALGSILCEILTGAPAYDAATASEAYLAASRAWLDDAARRLDSCGADAALVDVARRCLAQNPADRPTDAGAVAAEIERHLRDLDARAREAVAEAAAARARAEAAIRRRRLVAFASSAIVALVAFSSVVWLRAERERAEREARADRSASAALAHARSALERARAEKPGVVAAWADAESVATRQAEIVASGGASPEIRAAIDATLSEARAGRGVAEAEARVLDGVLSAHERQGDSHDARATDRAYDALFKTAGVDVLSDGAAQRLANHRLRDALLSALDEWIVLRRAIAGKGAAAALIGLAEAAETDPWRRELRAAWLKDDVATVARLSEAEGRRERPTSSLLLLSRALRRAGREEAGLAVLRDAIADRPDDYDLRHEYATALNRAAKADPEVVAHLTAALALKPGSAHARTDLAQALIERGLPAEARAYLDAALKIRPNDAVAHEYLGVLAFRSGDATEAERLMRRALELDPTATLTRSKLGLVLLRLGRVEESVSEHRRAVAEAPSRPDFRLHLAGALLASGDPVEAVAHFRAALAETPGTLGDWYDYGRALFHDDADGAADAFERATKLDPTFPEAWCNLGLARIAVGRLEPAVDALAKGHELGSARQGWRYPSDSWLDEARALAAAEAALDAFDPDDAESFVDGLSGLELERRVSAAFVLGRFSDAKRMADAAADLSVVGPQRSGVVRAAAALAAAFEDPAARVEGLEAFDALLDDLSRAPEGARAKIASSLRRHHVLLSARRPSRLSALDPAARADFDRRLLRLDLMALDSEAASKPAR